MVSDKDVASLAVQTFVVRVAFGILGELDDKAEIDADALVDLGSMSRTCLGAISLVNLGRETDGTIVDFGS